MALTAEDIKKLSSPFADDRLGIKCQSLSKDKTWAMLVPYLQHTDVADRLDEVDPAWSCEVTGQVVGETITTIRMRMTVKGVIRENVGEGEDPKSAASDALKRCAMLFGVGRYLYDSEKVWVKYNEAEDKFRVWTVADYKSARGGNKLEIPSAGKPAAQGPAPSVPQGTIKPSLTVTPAAPSGRQALGKGIVDCKNALKMTDAQLEEYVTDEYKKPLKSLSLIEMGSLLEALQTEVGRKGVSA